MDQQPKKWYVVTVISGKENKAKEYIEGEVTKRGWHELVPQVLVPTEKVVSIKDGKRVIKERVIYKGYVYIEVALSKEVESVIQNVPNVLDFLREPDTRGRLGTPIPVRTDEINRILGNMDDQLDASVSAFDNFVIGEAVKVIDGPFSTFSGIIEEVNNERKSLKVAVKIFGRKTPVELGFNQVEKE